MSTDSNPDNETPRQRYTAAAREYDRLVDDLEAVPVRHRPPARNRVNQAAPASKREAAARAAPPATPDTAITESGSGNQLQETPHYPELPEGHIYNTMVAFPATTKPWKIRPSDCKAISDRYGGGELDPDTGRPRSLRNCCEVQGVDVTAFLELKERYRDISEYHERAGRMRADMLADQILTEAYDRSEDLLEYTEGTKGTKWERTVVRANNAAVRRSELIVKGLQLRAGQLHREKYAPETLVKSAHLHLHGAREGDQGPSVLALDDIDRVSIDDLLRRQSTMRLGAPK